MTKQELLQNKKPANSIKLRTLQTVFSNLDLALEALPEYAKNTKISLAVLAINYGCLATRTEYRIVPLSDVINPNGDSVKGIHRIEINPKAGYRKLKKSNQKRLKKH
jgi:hypothetical protein